MSVIIPNTDVLRTSVIVANPNVPQPQAAHKQPQLGFGNGIEPEKEKNPQLEPEKEKNPQLEPEKGKKPQLEPVKEKKSST